MDPMGWTKTTFRSFGRNRKLTKKIRGDSIWCWFPRAASWKPYERVDRVQSRILPVGMVAPAANMVPWKHIKPSKATFLWVIWVILGHFPWWEEGAKYTPNGYSGASNIHRILWLFHNRFPKRFPQKLINTTMNLWYSYTSSHFSHGLWLMHSSTHLQNLYKLSSETWALLFSSDLWQNNQKTHLTS